MIKEVKCPDCNNIMEKIKRIPLKKRYFYRYRLQGNWYICNNCKHIWTDKGIKKTLTEISDINIHPNDYCKDLEEHAKELGKRK